MSDKTFSYTAGNHLRQVQEDGNPALDVPQYLATYDYDDNGNLVEKSKDAGDDLEVTSYDFDVRDHLRSVNFQVGAVPPTNLGAFDYDSAGLRVHATTPDRGDVDYFYDGSQVVEERDASSGSALARYHYGLATVAVSDLAGGGATSKYFHHDGLGTTSHLTDDSGDIRADYMVDPWGQPRDTARYQGGFVHQPTAAALSSSDPDADRNRKLFTGHEYDKSSGLIYAKARYYDPNAGRFLSSDAYLGDAASPMSLHRYNYAHGSPTFYTDPTGYCSQADVLTDCSLGQIMHPSYKEAIDSDGLTPQSREQGRQTKAWVDTSFTSQELDDPLNAGFREIKHVTAEDPRGREFAALAKELEREERRRPYRALEAERRDWGQFLNDAMFCGSSGWFAAVWGVHRREPGEHLPT